MKVDEIMKIDQRESGMEFHEIASLFPMMVGQDFKDLIEDIRTNGLHEPVWLYEGKILDGRNRWLACEDLGITADFREYEGDDPVGFVVSLNLTRRHLNESQRAMVAGKLATMKQGTRTDLKPRENSPEVSNKEAASLMNVSDFSIKKAKHVQKDGTPELVSKVEAGEVKVSVASDIATLPKEEQAEVVARGEKEILQAAKAIRSEKSLQRRQQRVDHILAQCNTDVQLDTAKRYPVIYADPPWCYDFSASDSREVENHYPTMALEDIKALPVPKIATDDAVLLLWATNPKLPEGIAVMESWGFYFRTALSWDKSRIGMGYWARQQAEPLLIGTQGKTPVDRIDLEGGGSLLLNTETLLLGTRGDMPAPLPENRPSSVIRAPAREHSRKPNEVYKVIETMFPEYPKIELFARGHRQGWDVYGYEAA